MGIFDKLKSTANQAINTAANSVCVCNRLKT